MDYVWLVQTEEVAWDEPSNDISVHKTKEGAQNEFIQLKQQAIVAWNKDNPEYETEYYEDENSVIYRIYDFDNYYENYYEIKITKINFRD